MNNNGMPDNDDDFKIGVEAGENELGALLSEDVGENDADDGLGGDGQPAPVTEQPVAVPTPAPTPTSVPATPAAATQPVATPAPAPVASAPVAAVTPPVAAAPVPAAPVAQPVVQQPAPVAPAQPQQDPAIVARETYQRFRGETETALAQGHYSLPQEAVDRFNAGDFSDIPKMMARVYLDAYTAAVAHMNTYFPNMLESTTQVRDTNAQHEANFFQVWPQLNMKDHGADLERFGKSYRQMYPSATPEEFIRDVGAQVVVARRLPLSGVAPAAPATNGGASPTAPAARPAHKSFTPASGQSGGSPPPQQSKNVNKNPFTELAEDVDELDLD